MVDPQMKKKDPRGSFASLLAAAAIARLTVLAKNYAKKKVKGYFFGDAESTGEYRGKFYYPEMTPDGDPIPAGYMCKRFLGITYRRVPIYTVCLDPKDPLRYHDHATGLEFRTNMVLSTDFGSIPWTAQKLSRKNLRLFPDSFRIPYLSHDGGYNSGGFWVRRAPVEDPDPRGIEDLEELEAIQEVKRLWVFVHLSRAQVDALLWSGLAADGANHLEQILICGAVRVGAGRPWRNYRNRDNRLALTGSVKRGRKPPKGKNALKIVSKGPTYYPVSAQGRPSDRHGRPKSRPGINKKTTSRPKTSRKIKK
jgi:hypothetical protein